MTKEDLNWISIEVGKPEFFEEVMIWCRLKYGKEFIRLNATYNRDKRLELEGDEWLIDGNRKVMEVKYICKYPEDPE